jgi:hypothetical protein
VAAGTSFFICVLLQGTGSCSGAHPIRREGGESMGKGRTGSHAGVPGIAPD